MENTFRYVFNDRLFEGYSQPMPFENGRRVYRIFYPEHTDQFGDFFEVIETGDLQSPFEPKTIKTVGLFYRTVIDWFSDYRLLSD
jgi:hypothetical protein